MLSQYTKAEPLFERARHPALRRWFEVFALLRARRHGRWFARLELALSRVAPGRTIAVPVIQLFQLLVESVSRTMMNAGIHFDPSTLAVRFLAIPIMTTTVVGACLIHEFA